MQQTLGKALKLAVHSKAKYFIYAFYVLLGLITIYHLAYSKRIIPGVKVGSVHVGGMTYLQAKKALQDYEKTVTKEVVLKLGTREFKISGSDIGLVYNWDDSVSRAFEVGRSGKFFTDTKDKIAGLLNRLYIPAFYDYDDTLLSSKLSVIKAETNIDAVDAGVSFLQDEVTITIPSKEGIKVVDDSLQFIVLSSFDRVNFTEKSLPVKTIKPKIIEQDLVSVLPEIQKIIFNEISIVGKNKSWMVGKNQLLDFLKVTKTEKIGLALNELKFEAFVDSLAQEVNKLPRGQVVSTNGDMVTSFKLIQDGEELDKKAFTKLFTFAYFNQGKIVDLPMIAVSGPGDKEKYGILALLGEGSSTYVGSIPARIHNLTLAGERTNGVLVPPGSIYSMNNSVGDISYETDYDVAYIIKEGRTVLGAGGGVCQTSTTLFRAVLNAGLPVVQRNAHAYRVSYYEQDKPVGFDAAVYQPTWDFQFKNDTMNYVLVQFSYNQSESKATFKLYGTPDGRSVEITEPVVSNQTPPPPALYQDDPTLAKGVVRQVDYAVWGATSKFSRTVSRGENVLFTETYTSRYQPWRAVFLVGTK
jgi:vancomycin resistance protein YoaR